MRPTLLGLILITGCTSSNPNLAADGGGGGGDAASGAPNVVDTVVLPMLAASGLSVTPEDEGILCRRLAIDLTGLVPTPDEVAAHCAGKSPADMAGYFLNKPSGANAIDGSPPYVWINRRWWADSFQYQSGVNPSTTYYPYVRELDQLVNDLYAGKIAYDVFAAKALASPAFARRFGVFEANHDLVQLASQAWRVFLGREALPSEAEDFGNLWRGWTTQYMNEAASEAAYPDCPVTYDQNQNRNGCRHYELGLLGSQCAGVSQVSCQSTVLGAAQVVPSAPAFVRWADLGAADRAQLEQVGTLIAKQPEFAEAAVDRALAKYLGWWKAGFYRPDFDVPAVRDALAQKLRADHYDLRKLELEIVTSVLYTQAAAKRPEQLASVPLWAFGPSKLLYAEAWLDSVGQALGKQVGGCDFRYTSPGASKISGYYAWKTSSGIAGSFYSSNAQNMGGCPVASTHGDASGLVPAVTRRVVLSQLCPGAFVPSASADLDALVQRAFDGLGRAPSAFEKTTLLSRMTVPADGGCDPANLSTCNLQPIADALCTSLFATASFNYY
jgi:hypothetical protein